MFPSSPEIEQVASYEFLKTDWPKLLLNAICFCKAGRMSLIHFYLEEGVCVSLVYMRSGDSIVTY